jgi:hypothetical protein
MNAACIASNAIASVAIGISIAAATTSAFVLGYVIRTRRDRLMPRAKPPDHEAMQELNSLRAHNEHAASMLTFLALKQLGTDGKETAAITAFVVRVLGTVTDLIDATLKSIKETRAEMAREGKQ